MKWGVNKKSQANDVFWRLILFFSHSLLFLQPSSAVAFCCHFSWCHEVVVRIWREFDADSTPAGLVTPPWNVYTTKFDPGWEDYPVWSGGSIHMWCKRDQITIWEITWIGGLPQLLAGSPLPCKQALRGQTPNLAFSEDVSIKQRKTSQLQENLPTFNKLNEAWVWITHLFSVTFSPSVVVVVS